ncbi:DNA-binding WRKY [Corchorus olitorius]|uniref:DNA-binding WRKY n=1 Tax=Corchorus olitorius TaxID=93759 RepID=A0A1R3GE59_9ROSI|nr:DNA-binding WRKY [Corchorus olitorius]
MENMREWEQRNLINELTEGRELAKQVQLHLNVPSSSSSSSHDQTRELILLVQKIQASYEKALSILNFNTSNLLAGDNQQPPLPSSGVAIRMPESPPSRSVSPRSEDSDREHELKDASKKRGYYRCTHRNVQGCLATKQRGLKVITENLDNIPSFPYHNNPSSSTTSNVKVETSNVFSPCVVGNLSSPSFLSPATSATTTNNYFSVSPSPTGMMMNMSINLGTSETADQLSGIIQAAATSATNSPTVGLDNFPFGNTQFDPNFTFDNHGFFS